MTTTFPQIKHVQFKELDDHRVLIWVIPMTAYWVFLLVSMPFSISCFLGSLPFYLDSPSTSKSSPQNQSIGINNMAQQMFIGCGIFFLVCGLLAIMFNQKLIIDRDSRTMTIIKILFWVVSVQKETVKFEDISSIAETRQTYTYYDKDGFSKTGVLKRMKLFTSTGKEFFMLNSDLDEGGRSALLAFLNSKIRNR